MLAITLLVPKPRDDGIFTWGPASSFHSSSRKSSTNFQVNVIRPCNDDSAPYLAALVASSCKAKASVCAVEGSNRIFGPTTATRRASLVTKGASSSSIRPLSSAPTQLDNDRMV